MSKSTKYLYGVDANRWANMLYRDALADRYECARKLKAVLAFRGKGFSHGTPEYDEIYVRYVAVCKAMEFNADRIKELEV